jgi:hypothetical protein
MVVSQASQTCYASVNAPEVSSWSSPQMWSSGTNHVDYIELPANVAQANWIDEEVKRRCCAGASLRNAHSCSGRSVMIRDLEERLWRVPLARR